ncbi:MAG: hypothetical protein V4556_02005 [Bacteroidota bacterium]
MEKHYHYETVTEAINELRQKGYNLDFNLEENCIVCDMDKFKSDEFDIVEVYRYEGDSDPADEATVYGIQSTSGLKGILVTGFGSSLDNSTTNEILKKLHG